MTDLSTLRFFRTPAHPCSYLDDREATTLFVDPSTPMTSALYSRLSQRGFRRSGEFLYRPHCQGCNACIPVRVPVNQFQWRRRHRRLLERNADLTVESRPARFDRELYSLYARYIISRHGDGDMYPPSEEQFTGFLISQWSDTRFFCFRAEGKLLAVAVVDRLEDGLSAVYTFYDPDESSRGLGNLAVLWELERCRREGLPYLYLGYLVDGCKKMAYKGNFRPLERLRDNVWQPSD
ncbi:arginyltransferase [Alcanivorax sp. 1008]|uniref:arginyltransferase n=1 Tax=Alcanivorax sp. 1008 TaxID=2816853 RepID=UPI001D42446D|nr:arginyltransferase [Alcanivorax sp. 1008]MCC1497782.1 arginyltransferase [Alcanivorax sp. 1008]